ncbi:MAG TPA: ABC transporter ATP-binding protein [Solirubrobacteraceae bacterium]|jgi:iron(III) transport system ATP-binding protein|nr:ABC transporter ATP-binding protein [Solirubrobacteraceae bacterium]
MSAASLEARELWKRYRLSEPVLRGASVTADAGSLVAVLGLSGCGKTTLLRAIAGFERPERGSVALGARTLDDELTHVAPEDRRIGYVPQEGALFPNLDVRANVAFGMTRAERRTQLTAQLLELVGLADLAHRYPHQLSGGEQQRVALARALAREPDALLLDEPFSSLDASLRTTVREEVSALLRRQGVTTVIVTHDQEEALSLADSVAVLRDGVVVQQGTPSEIYEQPADAGVATFLGSANLLEAKVQGAWTQSVVGRLPLRTPQTTGAESDSAIIVVRPEQLRVEAAESSHEGLLGTVEQCRYYGHDAVLQIGVAQQPHAQTLLARVAAGGAFAEGTAVRVSAEGSVAAV